MDNNINLLKRAQTPQGIKNKIKRTLNVIGLSSIIIFALLTLTLFFVNLFIVFEVKDINQKTKAIELRINSLSQIETVQRSIIDKISALEKILDSQMPFDENLTRLKELLPTEVSISQITLGGSAFSVSVTSDKLSTLNLFITNIISPELGGKHFSKVVLEGLSIDDKGIYRMNVSGVVL